jgi:hypothetical protein
MSIDPPQLQLQLCISIDTLITHQREIDTILEGLKQVIDTNINTDTDSVPSSFRMHQSISDHQSIKRAHLLAPITAILHIL